MRRKGMAFTHASSDRQEIHWESIDAENDEEFSLQSHSELPRVLLLSFALWLAPARQASGNNWKKSLIKDRSLAWLPRNETYRSGSCRNRHKGRRRLREIETVCEAIRTRVALTQ